MVRVKAIGRGRKRSPIGEKIGQALGPGGYCICPRCGYKERKEPGIACREKSCPVCGYPRMVRVGSYHYQRWKETGVLEW